MEHLIEDNTSSESDPADGAARARLDVLERMLTEQPRRLPRKMQSHVADRETAEELSQETLTRALQSLSGLRGPADEALVCSWVDTIASNLIRNHYRDSSRAPRLEPFDDVLGAGLVDKAPEPADVVVQEAARAALTELIDTLPQELKLVFLRRVIDSRTTAEVAAEFGISDGLVRWRLHRARTLLREQVDR